MVQCNVKKEAAIGTGFWQCQGIAGHVYHELPPNAKGVGPWIA